MDRRSFNAMLLGGMGLAAAAPALGVSRKARKLVLYSAVDADLIRYEVDPVRQTLTKREAITLPAFIQYAWPHPAGGFLYVASSSGKVNRLSTLRIGANGVLAPYGQDQVLPQRPIHISVDGKGCYLYIAYNVPADVAVHPIARDGSVGARIDQAATLDKGIFPHQVRSLPGDRSVVLVTRGNDATAKRPEDPGALKLYHSAEGQLSPLKSISVGGKGGLGYGPRHLDFHLTQPWAYVGLERQNELHMHRIVDDALVSDPDFIRRTTPQNDPRIRQVVGATHVHPQGKAVYVSNRASGTVEYEGQEVARGGDNSIAVFAIHPRTGEPALVQRIDPQGYHIRSFTVDPGGKLLIAATMQDMLVRNGDKVRHVSAGLTLFRIADDGTLSFIRKYDVTLPPDGKQMWVQALNV